MSMSEPTVATYMEPHPETPTVMQAPDEPPPSPVKCCPMPITPPEIRRQPAFVPVSQADPMDFLIPFIAGLVIAGAIAYLSKPTLNVVSEA